MKFGIICAMQEEIKELKAALKIIGPRRWAIKSTLPVKLMVKTSYWLNLGSARLRLRLLLSIWQWTLPLTSLSILVQLAGLAKACMLAMWWFLQRRPIMMLTRLLLAMNTASCRKNASFQSLTAMGQCLDDGG